MFSEVDRDRTTGCRGLDGLHPENRISRNRQAPRRASTPVRETMAPTVVATSTLKPVHQLS